MKFRPCIDIHNGKVKQIVGGSLTDQGNKARENFVSSQDAPYFARLYRDKGLKGGHIILLNSTQSEFYQKTKEQALEALSAAPGWFQAGGGITPRNAEEFLRAGASHVIVTSYVFKDGQLHYDRLKELLEAVGRRHLVLDLSCRRKGEDYYIVTDRWQNYTEVRLNGETIEKLSKSCDEFLIHAVDVEGKAAGIEEKLAGMLGKECRIPVTYAGGVHNFDDLETLRRLGGGRIDVTIGSALEIFGGNMKLEEVIRFCNGQRVSGKII